MNYKPIVTTSMATQIADVIQQAILDGTLRINERLASEEELAAQFGVSRPTVREALKRLAARHLLRSRRGPSGGNFVSGPSPEQLAQSFGTAAAVLVATGGVSLDEMATARFEMEAICCRLAADCICEADLDALRKELEHQRQADITDEEFCASDVRFHRLIVEASGNAILRFVMNLVVETLMPVSNMIIFRVRDRRTICALHARIVEALARRDGEGAVSVLSELIAYIRTQYEAEERQRFERAGFVVKNQQQAER